jgi:hypothetical protein
VNDGADAQRRSDATRRLWSGQLDRPRSELNRVAVTCVVITNDSGSPKCVPGLAKTLPAGWCQVFCAARDKLHACRTTFDVLRSRSRCQDYHSLLDIAGIKVRPYCAVNGIVEFRLPPGGGVGRK